MLKRSLFTTLAVVMLFSTARANTIITNGPPNSSGGSDLNAFLEADNFLVVDPSVRILEVRFWALETSPADFAGSVDWAIYSNSGVLPGVSLFSGNASATGVATGNTTLGMDEYDYRFGVDVTLGTGSYWLVLHNGPSNAQPATNFYWAWSSDSGNSVSQDLSVDPAWAGNSASFAFELNSSPSPEPASLALVGGGMLAALLLRRKAKGSKA